MTNKHLPFQKIHTLQMKLALERIVQCSRLIIVNLITNYSSTKFEFISFKNSCFFFCLSLYVLHRQHFKHFPRTQDIKHFAPILYELNPHLPQHPPLKYRKYALKLTFLTKEFRQHQRFTTESLTIIGPFRELQGIAFILSIEIGIGFKS